MSGCRECGIGTPPVPSGWHAPGCSLRIEAEAAITPLARAVTDNNLLLHAALRRLVEVAEEFAEPVTEDEVRRYDEAIAAARAALAATDVRGALAEAIQGVEGMDDWAALDVDQRRYWLTKADAILAALAAKGVEG